MIKDAVDAHVIAEEMRSKMNSRLVGTPIRSSWWIHPACSDRLRLQHAAPFSATDHPPCRRDAVTTDGPLQQAMLAGVLLAIVGTSLVAAPGPDGLTGALLGALMLAIAVTDARRYLIPNELTGAAAALALVRAAAIGPDAGWYAVLWTVGQALAIALPLLGLMAGYRALRGRDGLGLGDVKLAAVAGPGSACRRCLPRSSSPRSPQSAPTCSMPPSSVGR